MSDFIGLLSNALAANKQRDFRVNQTHPTVLPWATGSRGYGDLGSAIGSAISSNILEPRLQAMKKQYALENDPQMIAQQAQQSKAIWDSLPEESKSMVMNNPGFQKKLESYESVIPGITMLDSKTGRRMFSPQTKTFQQQKDQALELLSPEDRLAVIFSGERKDQAQGQYYKTEADYTAGPKTKQAEVEAALAPEKLQVDQGQLKVAEERNRLEAYQLGIMKKKYDQDFQIESQRVQAMRNQTIVDQDKTLRGTMDKLYDSAQAGRRNSYNAKMKGILAGDQTSMEALAEETQGQALSFIAGAKNAYGGSTAYALTDPYTQHIAASSMADISTAFNARVKTISQRGKATDADIAALTSLYNKANELSAMFNVRAPDGKTVFSLMSEADKQKVFYMYDVLQGRGTYDPNQSQGILSRMAEEFRRGSANTAPTRRQEAFGR